MPTAVADSSSTTEQIRHRKPRNPEIDPYPNRPKPTISLLLSSAPPTTEVASKKKNNFSSATFRGLGCAASPQVSVPAVIRTSANWEAKKLTKKRLKTKKTGNDQLLIRGNSAVSASGANLPPQLSSSLPLALSSSCVVAPDVWCGAGIGMSTDAASVIALFRGEIGEGKWILLRVSMLLLQRR